VETGYGEGTAPGGHNRRARRNGGDEPKTKLTVYVWWVAVTLVAFFAIRFDVVYYRNTRIICWGTTDSFLTGSKDVIVLGNYTLATDYGPVYLNWFCDIYVISKNVSGIDIGKKSSHDLRLLGQSIGQNTTATYRGNGVLGTLSGGHNSFSLGPNTFTYSVIYFNGSYTENTPNEMLFSGIVFDRMILDDGMEIVFSDGNSYDLCLDIEKDEWIITIVSEGSGNNKYYFLVKRPDEQEYVKYSEVRFEPYWGSFLEGTVFQEPVEDQQSEEPADEWWFSY
jgi:hypothetical protein